MATTSPIKIGLVGLGKIAVDQHIPAIRNNPGFELVAGCSPHARPEGISAYNDMAAMLAAHPEIEALAICTPPQVRHRIAKDALATGRHVFLEKPPATTLGEAEALRDFAAQKRVTLLASWHSRFAPAVNATREWIAQRKLKSMHIVWKENVRQWHPGQAWIFAPGGMGVFDPGINALSILTAVVGDQVIVKKADLHIPVNCDSPIAVQLEMVTEQGGVPVRADFDFLQENLQTWSIYAEAEDGGKLALHMGGTTLEIDGAAVMQEPEREYPGLYAHFHALIAGGRTDADFAPLRIVADAFMLGKRIAAPEYVE
jgi:D-galactose 1-dehydrogenase/L-arabinose 1- dehydrogenase